ncbi:hypothetical protein NYO12_29905 (plasmid) [Klebsiella variicola]|nr:hypothetical protein [Klebsiella variicola]UVW56039.1 hypothetical protein NYO12_29905 [Klebsiella variicola]
MNVSGQSISQQLITLLTLCQPLQSDAAAALAWLERTTGTVNSQ